MAFKINFKCKSKEELQKQKAQEIIEGLNTLSNNFTWGYLNGTNATSINSMPLYNMSQFGNKTSIVDTNTGKWMWSIPSHLTSTTDITSINGVVTPIN